MAGDDNQQPVSGDATATTAGSDNKVKTALRRLHPGTINKKKIMAALTILIVLVSVWAVAGHHIGPKVYAQAAGHRIYKREVKDLIGTTKGVSNHDAAIVLADKYLTEAMAKDANIKITSQDIATQYPGLTRSNSTKIVYQRDINDIYFNKLVAYNSGWYKGQLLATNFSRHIAFDSPFLAFQKESDPLLGNRVAIAQDKQYAKDLINKLYNQVRNHKITFNQAIQIEQKDPQVGISAYRSAPHSGSFDTSNVFLPGTALIKPADAQQKLSSMKAGELSPPFAVRVANSLTDKQDVTDSYYLVIHLDSATGSHSGLNFSEWLAQAKKRLGYKINV